MGALQSKTDGIGIKLRRLKLGNLISHSNWRVEMDPPLFSLLHKGVLRVPQRSSVHQQMYGCIGRINILLNFPPGFQPKYNHYSIVNERFSWHWILLEITRSVITRVLHRSSKPIFSLFLVSHINAWLHLKW